MKKLPKSWTTVTPFSRKLALLLFILLPIVAFWYGIQYEKILVSQNGATCQPQTLR